MDDLLSQIQKRAAVWAQQISRKANATFGKPKHINVSSKVEVGNGEVYITSTAASDKGDARAYEYGSGIHSTSKKTSRWQQGEKGKILITPKNKPVLAFEWQKLSADPPGTRYGKLGFGGQKLIMKSEKSPYKALFHYVEHPGVRAAGDGKGYLRPAIAEVRKGIRKELTREMRDAYLGGIRKVFKQ